MWKAPFPSSPPFCRNPSRRAAFTLVELLVSMTVLILIVALYSQVIQSATSSITRSSKGMDINQAAAITLDRIGNSIKNMVTTGSGTIVVIKNMGGDPSQGVYGSDGLAMITNGRVQNRTTATNISVDNPSNIRLAARGYGVFGTADADLVGSPLVPMLNWGDGTIAFNAPSIGTSYVEGQPLQALYDGSMDVFKRISGGTEPTTMLEFSPVSSGIFRFEVCVLLSDGTIASGMGRQLPLTTGALGPPLPRNKNLVAGEAFANPPVSFTTPLYPLALSAADSDIAPTANSNGQNVYARAIIVGIASLDVDTRKLLTAKQRNSLAGTGILDKAQDGQTPLDAWDISSATSVTARANRTHLNTFPPPVLQNIRFSQRYFYVN